LWRASSAVRAEFSGFFEEFDAEELPSERTAGHHGAEEVIDGDAVLNVQ
jgi:hypothetical protein